MSSPKDNSKAKPAKQEEKSTDIIISYLEGQLENLEQELKTYDIPIVEIIKSNDIRQFEEMIIKKQVYLLKALIKGAKAIDNAKK